MLRVLQSTVADIGETFYRDGVATDPTPATATVTITRDDGTAVVTDAATARSGVGEFVYSLSAVDTASLDVLTVVWTSSLGSLTTTVEVVGGFLFTIAQARALKPLEQVAYTAQRIVDARTLAETALEDACGVAFVPRYKRESVSGNGGLELMLSQPRVTAIRSVSLDGAAGTAADFLPNGSGILYTANRFERGYQNYEIAYEHGWPSPPPRVTQAALKLAKRYLVDQPQSDRATSMTTDDGTTQFLVTAGVRQAVFDVPEANAVVNQYSLQTCVA